MKFYSDISAAILAMVLVAGTAFAAERPVTEALLAEARELMKNQSQWTAWENASAKVFADNEKLVEHWALRSAPPRPNLIPLQLPLPFMAAQLLKESANHDRIRAWLWGIGASPDKRRIDFVMEYKRSTRDSDSLDWNHILAAAATREWAAQQIGELVQQSMRANSFYDSLFDNLLQRFAPVLPENLQSPVYSRLRQIWPKGPSNGDGERIWDLLIRIDGKRARHDLISFYDEPEDPRWPGKTYDLYVVFLLERYKEPNAEVAEAARKWLAALTPRRDELFGSRLKVVLLHSDPQKELGPTLDRIRELIRENKPKRPLGWGDELQVLVKAVQELKSDAAAEAIAEFATKPPIPDITRYSGIQWLVQRRHPKLPSIIAWWLANEKIGQSWIRNAATNEWGDYGKQLLKEAEQLGQLK